MQVAFPDYQLFCIILWHGTEKKKSPHSVFAPYVQLSVEFIGSNYISKFKNA